MKFWKFSIAAVGLAAMLAGCGGGGGGGGGGTASSSGGGGSSSSCPKGGTTSGTGTETVTINPDPNTIGRFDPKTVNAKVGDTIEWTWADTASPHTVTANDGSFDSCTQNAGFKFFVTVSKAGDIQYHCTLHSGMVGDIKVS